MAYVDIIGFLAGALTTIALVPQAAKAWKTKHTKDISFLWALTLTLGVFFWLIYGLLIGSFPIIAANSLTLILSAIVLALKIKYK